MTLSSGSNFSMGRFARLSQSARLLSCTLGHVSNCPSSGDHRVDEEVQLCRTLLALVNVFHIEESKRRLEFCTKSAVCYRYSLFHLFSTRATTDRQSAILILEMYYGAQGGFRSGEPLYPLQCISRDAEAVLKSVNAIVPRLLGTSNQCYAALDYVSPFVLHVVYLAATLHLNLHWIRPSSSHKEYKALRGALGALDHRWTREDVSNDTL